MKSKQYHNGVVAYEFNHHHRKWNFNVPTAQPVPFTLIIDAPGGAETAHRIAELVAKDFQRHGRLCSNRNNIHRLVEAAKA